MSLRTSPARVGAVLVLALLTAGCWCGWLAWDETYQVDPATGIASGPYEAWQVIGCVVSLLVVGGIALALLRPLTVGLTMTLAFTLAFAATSVPGDESGLSLVGVLMVGIGMALATSVAGLVSAPLTRRRRRRTA